jgi:hypothetical protein
MCFTTRSVQRDRPFNKTVAHAVAAPPRFARRRENARLPHRAGRAPGGFDRVSFPPGTNQMQKAIPLVGVLVATFFVGSAAIQFSGPVSAINPKKSLNSTILGGGADQRSERPSAPRSAEPVHMSLIRCLTDLDDLLDTIRDPASFAAVKPKLLARAREQADYAAANPGQGMSRLSKSAAKELQTAVNRHAASLERAMRVAPGVQPFMEKEMAAILNPK